MMNGEKMDMSTAASSQSIKTAEVRRFLESAGEALAECKRIQRRVEQLSFKCEKLVHRDGLAHPSEALQGMWKILEHERVRELEAVRHEMDRYRAVETFIATLPDPTERTVLRRRYLDGDTTWVRISFRLERDGVYYSQRQIQRIYATAMNTAQSLWESQRREAVTA